METVGRSKYLGVVIAIAVMSVLSLFLALITGFGFFQIILVFLLIGMIGALAFCIWIVVTGYISYTYMRGHEGDQKLSEFILHEFRINSLIRTYSLLFGFLDEYIQELDIKSRIGFWIDDKLAVYRARKAAPRSATPSGSASGKSLSPSDSSTQDD